jgi:hypothetical protein
VRHQRSPGGEPVCLREQEVPVSLVRACACPCVNVREECRPANAGSLQALDDDDDVFYLFLQEQSRSLADALMSDDVPRMRAHTPHPCLLTCLLARLHQDLHDFPTLGGGTVVVLDEHRHCRAGRGQH